MHPCLVPHALLEQVHQGYVDGAVCASNPALMAFARVLESYPHVSRRGVRVLSLSCGDEHAFMPTNAKGEVRVCVCAHKGAHIRAPIGVFLLGFVKGFSHRGSCMGSCMGAHKWIRVAFGFVRMGGVLGIW